MKVGLVRGYWGAGPPIGADEVVTAADDMGFESVWTGEAWGSDGFSPLVWWASKTSRIKLGTGICQISARPPATTAMHAMTLDHLSGGRHILGLGVSGPQVVEGWFGQDYAKPLARTREYVEIIRRIFAREGPVEYAGEHYQMPLQGGMGLGKPLKSIVHPLRADLPIYLGAEGPKNVALAAEIADGWLPVWFSPKLDDHYREALAEGFAREGARRTPDDFRVAAPVTIAIDDDIERAADGVRAGLGFYIGGMGAREMNFHAQLFARMGYEAECEKIQQLFYDGDRDGAIAAVTLDMVQDVAIVGPEGKVREDLRRWEQTALTDILVSGSPADLRRLKGLVEG